MRVKQVMIAPEGRVQAEQIFMQCLFAAFRVGSSRAIQLQLIEALEEWIEILLLHVIGNDVKGKKRKGQDGHHRDQHAGV